MNKNTKQKDNVVDNNLGLVGYVFNTFFKDKNANNETTIKNKPK